MTVDEARTLRDALFRARVSGVRVVRMADRTVEYRSDAEMAAQLEALDTFIAEMDPGSAAATHMNAGYSRT